MPTSARRPLGRFAVGSMRASTPTPRIDGAPHPYGRMPTSARRPKAAARHGSMWASTPTHCTNFQTFPPVLTGEILSKISPQGLFTVECFLWKSPRRFVGIFPLWKARNLSTRGCGGAALAIPGFAPLFHIKSYYYCCCYIYPLFLLERKTANAPIFPGAVENPAAQRRLIYEIFLR